MKGFTMGAVAGSVAIVLGFATACCAAETTPDASNQTAVLAAAPAPATPRPLRHGVFKFTSYPAAWTAAQDSNRPILIFATAPNCPHCVRMIRESLRAPHVNRFLCDSFETVYVDRVEQPELAAKLGLRLFPTTIIVGPDNQIIDVVEGYVDAKTLAARLQTTVASRNTDGTHTR